MPYASASDYAFVEQVVANSKSSFAMGMKVLPADRRGYLFAVYAYCRVLDDIADENSDAPLQNEKLDQWSSKVIDLKANKASCEITRVLLDAHHCFDLPLDELEILIDGMRRDVNGPVIAPTWEELYQYCREVAISVGLLTLPLFGRTDQGAQDFAHEVGYALQLTNIMRDIVEDAEINRLYLPSELLERYEIEKNPSETIKDRNLRKVLKDISLKVEGHYENAERLLIQHGTENLKPAILMMIVYQKTYEKMKKRGWHILTPRMRLSKGEKAMIVMKSLARL